MWTTCFQEDVSHHALRYWLSCSNSLAQTICVPCPVPLSALSMDICIEEGKNMYIQYVNELEYTIIEEGSYKISDLPLIEANKKSKKILQRVF